MGLGLVKGLLSSFSSLLCPQIQQIISMTELFTVLQRGFVKFIPHLLTINHTYRLLLKRKYISDFNKSDVLI